MSGINYPSLEKVLKQNKRNKIKNDVKKKKLYSASAILFKR